MKSLYIQKYILKSVWDHRYVDNERNNNGTLINWKIKLCFVCKSWFTYIQDQLNNSFILVKPYEMILNYRDLSRYSIYQCYPSKLEISSNSYISLLNQLQDEQSKYNFFSNIKQLLFIYNTGDDITNDTFKYIINENTVQTITTFKLQLFIPQENSRLYKTKLNLLNELINVLSSNSSDGNNCTSIEAIEFNNFMYDPEFQESFNKLCSLQCIGNGLKSLTLNYNSPNEQYLYMVESIGNNLNGLQVLKLADSDQDFNILMESFQYLKNIQTTLTSLSISLISNTNFEDQDHEMYKSFIQLLESMQHLTRLNIILNNDQFSELIELKSSKFELIKYIFTTKNKFKFVDCDCIFSTLHISSILTGILENTGLQIGTIDSSILNIKQLKSKLNVNEITINVGYPPIPFTFLSEIITKSVIINIPYNSITDYNQVIKSIRTNVNITQLHFNYLNLSNLKTEVKPLLLTQIYEVLIDPNSNLTNVILSIPGVQEVQSILKKINELKNKSNNNGILIWYESTIIKYANKKNINRDLKIYFENTLKT